MPNTVSHLPQLSGGLFLTDGGIETTLIFHEGFELPDFAAFGLLTNDEGRAALHKYYRGYAAIALQHGVGLVLESATWRASQDWGDRLGYTPQDMAEVNRQAIAFLDAFRGDYATEATPMVVSGCVGPRGDGYNPASQMDAAEAERYHGAQIGAFAEAGADMVTAITMTYAEEAIGITRAAKAAGLPAVISFTVETDGRLPSGQALRDAIAAVDTATDGGPAYYMINCAHPTHFKHVLTAGEAWLERIRGLRANASKMSHAELDEAEELDDGDPQELAADYRELERLLPRLNVMGGCCGTDHRHVGAICTAVAA